MSSENNKLSSVAIIPDGNRRWAMRQGASLEAAYEAVASSLARVASTFLEYNVGHLSIFALSKNNLKRNPRELQLTFQAHIRLMNNVLPGLIKDWDAHLFHVGDTSELPQEYLEAMNQVIEYSRTMTGTTKFYLYAGYDLEWEDAERARNRGKSGVAPEHIDLMIRTGGEYRLSGFMPRALEYAELFFVDTLFPDLKPTHIDAIVQDFLGRDRRFGR